ncbi:MAG TPA: EndoU domain-containing protein, partial [Myxococcaceae bacterium]|nr:EndoU domain-containing protein [Myxococcaceae bacterium]
MTLAHGLSAAVIVLQLTAVDAGTYSPAAPTDAVDQPGSHTVVAHLVPGTPYSVLKTGGPEHRWCKLETPSGPGWVLCGDAAGTPQPGGASASSAATGASCPTRCDATPLFAAMPSLSPTDREVLQMCPARPDASVTRGDVERFFRAHIEDPRLQRALSRAGRSGNREDNVAWLTGLWVGTGPRNAFTHVFCGDDWTRGKIGGLHWLPRYVQLEQDGKVCYRGPAKGKTALKDGEYTFRYVGLYPWSCSVKSVGGFTEDHDPVTLVALGTRAFVRCCPREGRNAVGVYAAADLGRQHFKIACGTRNGTYGIATFYPVDERPTCAE